MGTLFKVILSRHKLPDNTNGTLIMMGPFLNTRAYSLNPGLLPSLVLSVLFWRCGFHSLYC